MADLLERLLRRAPARPTFRYYPFSERSVSLRPVFRAQVNAAALRRDLGLIANMHLLAPKVLSKAYSRVLPVAPLLDISGADRRRWSPYKRAVDVTGNEVVPTDLITVDPEEGPYDPNTGEVWVPKKPRGRWGANIEPWRPGELYKASHSWWYGFKNADKVVICLKRKIRREVMHALGLSGKRGQNPPRYNEWSKVRC